MVNIKEGLGNVMAFASNQSQGLLGNPVATAIGGTIVGGTLVGTVAAIRSTRKKTIRKSSASKRKKTRKSSKRKYSYARTAGKGKDRSTRRIRMTKNGQPYIILKSGKARFISKASARASRKGKGGRY